MEMLNLVSTADWSKLETVHGERCHVTRVVRGNGGKTAVLREIGVTAEGRVLTHHEKCLHVFVEVYRNNVFTWFWNLYAELRCVQNTFEVNAVSDSIGDVHHLVGMIPMKPFEKNDLAHARQVEPLRVVD